jgi:hypothetical protein
MQERARGHAVQASPQGTTGHAAQSLHTKNHLEPLEGVRSVEGVRI